MNLLNYHPSRHFEEQRSQQRGVSPALSELVVTYGSTLHGMPNEAKYLYFSRTSIDQMTRAGVDKRLIQEAEKKRDCRWVVRGDVIVTVLYVCNTYRRLKTCNNTKRRYAR